MAVTFRGSCVTQYMIPTPNSSCFVLEVSARSMCKVNILKLLMQFDTLTLAKGTGLIMPLVKARKFTGTATGGIVLTGKVPWDTTVNAADAGIYLRLDPGFAGTAESDITITGTPKTMWQEFSARQTTGAEQWQSYDCVLVEPLDNGAIVLYPGELLEIYWGESSLPIGGIAFLEVVWEEDNLGTSYTVSGDVTLSGSAVSGAKILLVTDLDRDMPNPQVEVITTGAPGTWSKTLAAGVKADAFVQYRAGESLYSDEGKPYLVKP